MNPLTFEQLPVAVSKIYSKLEDIELLLRLKNEPRQETDQWFDLSEFCKYHPDKPSKATVYGWVNAGSIPVHKSAKKLRFLKSEIDIWLKQGRKKTSIETEAETDDYLRTKKGLTNG